MVRLEFSRRYSMAHRLFTDTSGKCLTPHGHDELVSVTLRPLKAMDFGGSNMTAAFERAKGRWHGWVDNAVDHAFQLNLNDPLLGYFQQHEPQRLGRIMTFDGDPTTEALAIGFLRKLTAFLEADGLFAADAVRVQETPTNACTLTAADLEAIDWSPGGWARRADDSLNDL